MNNSKNKRTTILATVLIGLLIIAYKTIFMSSTSAEFIEAVDPVSGGPSSISRESSILREIESINFNISVTQDPNFLSLISIEVPLISLPIGRSNPFSDI